MKNFVYCLILFILIYIFYYIFVLCRKSVLNNFLKGKEAMYLKFKYGLKINDKNIKMIANNVYLANSFILSATLYVISLFDNIFIKILIGLITLITLIIGLYHLIGIYYKKKQGGN